jgi:DNA-binding transcriptional LysR family regulator
LQTLCWVAAAGSIAAAAKGDPNRQSLFSRQIKELETALNLSLLDRSSTPYRLSSDALRIEFFVREMINGMDRVLGEAAGRAAPVCIGAGESILQWLVLPLLSPALAQGALRLRCENLRSREVVEALRHRRIDLGILSATHPAADLESRSLARYGLIAIGKSDVLPPGDEAGWADFGGRFMAVLEGSGALRRRFDHLSSEAPGGPQLALECTSYPQVIEVCNAGDMIGLLPGIAKRAAQQAGLRVMEIRELRDLEFELVLMWNAAIAEQRPQLRDVIGRLLGGKSGRRAGSK